MKNIINTIISDIRNVIIKGDSDKVEQARVFILLATPAMTAIFTYGKFPV